MRASPWSLSLLMMVLGVMLFYFARQELVSTGHAIPIPTYVASLGLVLGGVALFARKTFAYWIALAAGALTLAFAVASYFVHRDLVPTPVITGVMGLLVSARVLLARQWEAKERSRERLEQQRQEREEREERSSTEEQPQE